MNQDLRGEFILSPLRQSDDPRSENMSTSRDSLKVIVFSRSPILRSVNRERHNISIFYSANAAVNSATSNRSDSKSQMSNGGKR